ncbi:hypothetical protein [Sulfurirhabdus autotrophica]|uniref:hypothetical protein n=1 Tax=Sulfurirhabdus autotrophica TaxID=1706046 RepID=UPI0014049C46|nr:hypothetical protein [Sulfurirhabdus autotrophica]
MGKFFHAHARVENNLHIVLSNSSEEAVADAMRYGIFDGSYALIGNSGNSQRDCPEWFD